MRMLMVVTSLVSYFLNDFVSKAKYGKLKDFDFEAPLTHLVWITSLLSIGVTFIASHVLLARPASGIDPEPVVGAFLHHQLRHGGRAR